MKTVEQLQDCVKQSEERIRELMRKGEAIQATRPYTDKEAKALKGVFKDIEKEQDKIAELRQSILYIQMTPCRGIIDSFEDVTAQIKAVEAEVDAAPDKEIKAEIRKVRGLAKLKAQYKRLLFIVD